MEVKTDEMLSFCLFERAGRKVLAGLLYLFEKEEVPLNKVLYKEGEEPKHIYFVMGAQFKIHTTISVPVNEEQDLDLSYKITAPKKTVNRSVEVSE